MKTRNSTRSARPKALRSLSSTTLSISDDLGRCCQGPAQVVEYVRPARRLWVQILEATTSRATFEERRTQALLDRAATYPFNV
jgi:hypothetical protein